MLLFCQAPSVIKMALSSWCIWSYKGLLCVRLSASASFRVAITFQEFLQVPFLSKPSFTKFYIVPYLSTRVAEAFFDLVHISSIPTNPTRTLQESRSFIWRPWHIDLSLALLQKDLMSLSCVVLYSDLLTQQAPHFGAHREGFGFKEKYH